MLGRRGDEDEQAIIAQMNNATYAFSSRLIVV